MIKNLGAWGTLLFLGACDSVQAARPEAYQGVVELEERVLAFELPGRIDSVGVTRGGAVEEGHSLATLDDALDRLARDAQQANVEAAEARLALLREGTRREEIRATNAELEAARATEALVEQNLGRQRRLLASGATTASAIDQTEGELARARAHRTAIQNQLSAMRNGARDQEVRAAEAQVAAARAGLASTEERLARHTLAAPMAGSVLDVHVEPGEVVGPGTPVVTVVDPKHPFVDVFVPQGQIDRVRVDQPVHVRVDSLDEALDGRVEHISPRTEFTPRFLFSEQERPNLVIRVRIRVDDPEEMLRAGVPAFVSLVER